MKKIPVSCANLWSMNKEGLSASQISLRRSAVTNTMFAFLTFLFSAIALKGLGCIGGIMGGAASCIVLFFGPRNSTEEGGKYQLAACSAFLASIFCFVDTVLAVFSMVSNFSAESSGSYYIPWSLSTILTMSSTAIGFLFGVACLSTAGAMQPMRYPFLRMLPNRSSIETGMPFLGLLIAFAVSIVSVSWGAWSQSDILLNKAEYPVFQDECPGCHMINKLTMYRGPNTWCIQMKQETYYPHAPPPPPPQWRQLRDIGVDEDERRRLEQQPDRPLYATDFSQRTELEREQFGRVYHSTVWKNRTCVPDYWYFQNCANKTHMLYPDGCEPVRRNLSWVKQHVVTEQCTEDNYKMIHGWGDCFFASETHRKGSGANLCEPGTINHLNETCECECGRRCRTMLRDCEAKWTAEARYDVADCEAKEAVCEGTSVVYGLAVSGVFFCGLALVPFTWSSFIAAPELARSVNWLGISVASLSLILLVAAMATYGSFNDTINRTRLIFLEHMARTDIRTVNLDHPIPGDFFTQYLRPNPFSWERDLQGEEYIELRSQYEWNWSWHYLSRGFYCMIVAVFFQTASILLAVAYNLAAKETPERQASRAALVSQ